jgi:hypothetical protein
MNWRLDARVPRRPISFVLLVREIRGWREIRAWRNYSSSAKPTFSVTW